MYDESNNFFEQFFKIFKKEMSEMEHVNLIIAGRTGVGKSTLINAAFREDLAMTGIGKPVTEKMRIYEKDNFPLRIYDTVGLELDNETQNKTKNDIRQLCKEKEKTGDMDQIIHAMWYCVQSNSNRFEEVEKIFIAEMAELMPVILVLTQVITKKQAEKFKNEILKINPPVKNIILVLAQDYDDDDNIKKAFGVDSLVEFTASILPEAVQKAFTNVQKASIKMKSERAHAVVMTTAAASFGEGFIPLPFSDSAALVPTQIAMLASITAIFGINVTKDMITGFVVSLVGTTGATLVGRTIVSQALKFIPGVGTAIGGAISGTTAALITTALGETYIMIMEEIVKGNINERDLNTDRVQNMIKNVFATKLQKK